MVFHKHVLDVHQMGFAAGELIAHVNYMLVEGRLTAEGNRRRAALQDDLTCQRRTWRNLRHVRSQRL